MTCEDCKAQGLEWKRNCDGVSNPQFSVRLRHDSGPEGYIDTNVCPNKLPEKFKGYNRCTTLVMMASKYHIPPHVADQMSQLEMQYFYASARAESIHLDEIKNK